MARGSPPSGRHGEGRGGSVAVAGEGVFERPSKGNIITLEYYDMQILKYYNVDIF
jgi:hypothetical protein